MPCPEFIPDTPDLSGTHCTDYLHGVLAAGAAVHLSVITDNRLFDSA
jgi:hypothetical protein